MFIPIDSKHEMVEEDSSDEEQFTKETETQQTEEEVVENAPLTWKDLVSLRYFLSTLV